MLRRFVLIFALLGLGLVQLSAWQTSTERDFRIADTVSLHYLGPLQLLYFDDISEEYVGFDRVKDQIIGFDSEGVVRTKKQLSKEGPEGYGAVLEGISRLQSGNIFLVSNSYEFVYDPDWSLLHRKRRYKTKFSPLNLFKLSVYPSFRGAMGDDRVLSKSSYANLKYVKETYFDSAKVLLEYNLNDHSKSEVIRFLGLDHNMGKYFKSDYGKPIFRIDEFKNLLLLTFEYSNRIFRYSLLENFARIDDLVLLGEIFEDERNGVKYDFNGSERLNAVRENMMYNGRIMNFWTLDNHLIIKGQKGRGGMSMPDLSLNDNKSVENYTKKASQLLKGSTYQLYEGGILKRENLNLSGDILFISNNRIYVQKYADEEVEEDDIVIFIYAIE